jgi:hypothetical protein
MLQKKKKKWKEMLGWDLRFHCKSAGFAKQRLYDHSYMYGTVIDRSYKLWYINHIYAYFP